MNLKEKPPKQNRTEAVINSLKNESYQRKVVENIIQYMHDDFGKQDAATTMRQRF